MLAVSLQGRNPTAFMHFSQRFCCCDNNIHLKTDIRHIVNLPVFDNTPVKETMPCADSYSKREKPRAHYTDDVSSLDLRFSCASSLIEQQREEVVTSVSDHEVRACLRCVPHCNPWPLLPPPDGQPLNQDPVEVGALCLTACHCAMALTFFFLNRPLPEEMVSDWEQCVNSPVTLDKPARRPVTGTYGMFDRERGCESH